MTVLNDRPVLPAPLQLKPSDLRAAPTRWLFRYAAALVVLDSAVLLLAGLLGVRLRFGMAGQTHSVRGVPYAVVSLLLVLAWMAVLSLSRCYETRFLAAGTEEFKRVANTSFRVGAVVVFLAFMTKTEVARGYLLVVIPLGMAGLLAERIGMRMWVHRMRRRGRCQHKVVVVGPPDAALELARTLESDPAAGLHVVGACTTGTSTSSLSRDSLLPVLGGPSDVARVLNRVGADTVAVAAGAGITPEVLRQLSYDLEGSGVDLLVAPGLTNVSGTRITMRTLPGLPLMHLEEPELNGGRRLVKAVFDRTLGTLLLLAATPLLLVLALAVRLTSDGPAFFRQERVGRAGETFRIWKLRTMHCDAEQRRQQVESFNVHGETGILFKIHDDPRVTRIGKLLRRYSLDELPQLLNVVLGHMSLVGPRPPLQSEVDRYESHVHRRLLVKPGITGLWQVSGRSDLAWEESVRLDLHYVENWSLGLDLAVLAKTALAVLRPSGAY